MRFFVAAAAAVLVLSACQDPAGVGLGLIDEEQLDPNVRTVPATGLAATPDTSTAIGIAAATGSAQSRVLAGRVADPVFGDVRSVAYVDFLQPSSLDADAEADDVREAWLVLDRSYVYGDTTAALPLELREIQGAWSADPTYAADTLFATGDLLSTTDVVIADTLRRFDLPASWVQANAALLVGDRDAFSDTFEGFALDVPAGFAAAPGVVFGFNTFQSEGSGLRVVVDEDTLLYPLSEVFSSIAVSPPTMAPTDALAVRAGRGAGVRFDADFAAIGPTPLARAALRLPVEASLAQEGTFVRPLPTLSRLVGIRTVDGDEVATPLGNVAYDGDGDLRVLDATDLTDAVQALLLDPTGAFERYELRPLSGTVSLDIYPVTLPTDPASDAPPRFTLTVVGSAPE